LPEVILIQTLQKMIHNNYTISPRHGSISYSGPGMNTIPL